ncbi:hypothetical protein CEXT_385161 [Caerostris extrusa]|uniref:Uncharacterized protein n=1 Tax=Caerostris extrusa TaxID=172846 RepID=A0AAV4T4M7_CAEEX|nr:hypothetical protein CEXT_385161 [Caerostris extrusa]
MAFAVAVFLLKKKTVVNRRIFLFGDLYAAICAAGLFRLKGRQSLTGECSFSWNILSAAIWGKIYGAFAGRRN